MAVHEFAPSVFHDTLGSHEPVLRLEDGDTVRTTTLDAGGHDRGGVKRSELRNPQTGPFFVAGAEPGDALEVRLVRIEPSSAEAMSHTSIAPHLVEPGRVPALPAWQDSPSYAMWDIDRATGTAALASDDVGLGELRLPLAPMLGCFGVAPANGQAISTTTAGAHGGNMDYRGFTVGSTAYFPVSVGGGLFFLGDGHALQGDGEVVGTGLEVPMDVEFSLSVRKGAGILWPRGEDDEFLFAVGNARPLELALQHATSELLRWLEQEYGFEPVASNTLLGQCVQYDIGNVFNPAYTVVCKVPKRLVPGA